MAVEVVLVGAVRTAIGKFGGTLQDVPAVTLGELVIREAINRAGIRPENVDEVIMGNTLQAGQGQNIARQAAVKSGIPVDKPAMTINKVCGSGLRTVSLAAQVIQSGDADVIVAGGMENMSAAPYLLAKARTGYRMNDGILVDEMIKDGLWCAFGDVHMGITAENIAEKLGITRQEQDAFAVRSQERAALALESGRFKDEIVAVPIPQRKGDPVLFVLDEHARPGTTIEGLAKIPPAFKPGGSVTAGNASGINDAAAAVVVMTRKKAEELGVKPMARIIGSGSAGVDPAYMGLGPIPATRKALAKAGLSISDLDLIEANEAFASQALAVGRELELNPEITNVNGGAIALGHPIGCSGTRILVTLLYEMAKRESRYGLATLCIGGGQGTALVVERI